MANTKKKTVTAEEVKKEVVENVGKIVEEIQEEEALEKIRAIWLAETIRRQSAMDKEQKDAMQRKKLYQAFMQQKLNEEET